MAVFLRALGVWLLLLLGAVGNGGIRESVLMPRMSELGAHQLSCWSLSALILLVTFIAAPRLGTRSTRGLLTIGAFWVALTVSFEFAFGRLARGLSWDRLLADYDLMGGRLFVLCLLTTLLAPLVTARLRGL